MIHRKVTVGSCTILVTTCCLKESRFLYASIKDFTNMDLILRGVLWDCFHALRHRPVGRAAPDTAFVWQQSSGAQPKHRHRAQALAVRFALCVTLASENFHFSLRHCWFIWASSFGKRGAYLSLQRCLVRVRTQRSCRRLSMAHSSCKCAREKKICCHCVEASLAVLEKSFLFLSSISRLFSQGRSAKMEILV